MCPLIRYAPPSSQAAANAAEEEARKERQRAKKERNKANKAKKEAEKAERARLSAWLNDLQEDPRRATVRRSDLCLQLASLVAWWLADDQRGERETATELMLTNTLLFFRAHLS